MTLSGLPGLADLPGLRMGLIGPLPPPSGGMANQTRQLVALLTAAGATVTTVQINAPYRPSWAGRVPVLRSVFRLAPYLAALWRAAGHTDIFHIISNSGWSWHLFAAPAVWVARSRGVAVVVNYRGGEAEEFLQRSGRLVRLTMRRASALVVPSAFLQGVFSRFGMQADIVPNIINLSHFLPRDPVRRGAHASRHLRPWQWVALLSPRRLERKAWVPSQKCISWSVMVRRKWRMPYWDYYAMRNCATTSRSVHGTLWSNGLDITWPPRHSKKYVCMHWRTMAGDVPNALSNSPNGSS